MPLVSSWVLEVYAIRRSLLAEFALLNRSTRDWYKGLGIVVDASTPLRMTRKLPAAMTGPYKARERRVPGQWRCGRIPKFQ
jgi:hypothetical protein